MNVEVPPDVLMKAKSDAYALGRGGLTSAISLWLWIAVFAVAGVVVVAAGFRRVDGTGRDIVLTIVVVAAIVGIALATWMTADRWIWRESARRRVEAEGERLAALEERLTAIEKDARALPSSRTPPAEDAAR